MLQGINKIGKSWVGRVVVFILFGFLIISFAIWGIGDIFRGGTRTEVATIGKTDISADAYRAAYQNEFQQLIRRARRSVTPEQARALGLEARVLSRLVSEAALDQKAREMGLGVSDAVVAQSIQSDPSFRGANGAFDRALFTDLVRSNGVGEAQFVREQRGALARQQLAQALTGGITTPLAMRETVHRYETERRTASYFLLPAASLGEVAPATHTELDSFFGTRRAAFRAPEYRALNLLVLDAAAIMKPDGISDEDARRVYEAAKSSRYGTPERRTVQQIAFPGRAEAEAAQARIRDGTTFDAVAAERGVDAASLELGTFARNDMLDPAAAEAAFSLAEGAVSAPVEGRFGPVLLRVTKIEAGTLRPFEEVAPEVRREAALERARIELQTVHDAIEDQRAGAKPLAAIAAERGLSLVSVPAVDRQGRDKAGATLSSLPDREPLLQAAFATDIGADREALRTREGYIWFEVTGIEPGRDRPLDEVRGEVEALWRSDETARRLADKARAAVERLNKGDAMETVAAEAGQSLATATDLDRGSAAGALPQTVVTRIFATPVGKAESAPNRDEGRVVFKVTGAALSPLVTTTQAAASTDEQLRTLLADDLVSQYVAEVQREVGVRVNQTNVRRAIGGES